MAQTDIIYATDKTCEAILLRGKPLPYPVHTHVSVLTAGLVLEGSLGLWRCGSTIPVGNGETFTVAPHEPHTLLAGGNVLLLTVCVDVNSPPAPFRLPDALESLLPATVDRGGILGKIPEALAACRERAAATRREGIAAGICAARERLERAPEEDWRVRKLAAEAGLSVGEFIRRFRACAGLPPHRFLVQNRVRLAKRLLRQNLSLTETAHSSGFFDQSHFIRCFRGLLLMTPGEFRTRSR
ncbi:MAG: AraC family transcriptional regulator [Methylobacteriaceae bacterium]|jgi:AraC-like DNA-binding protein|nr:AraC family transcriptional regulator [Methylobacteriaceae bacterium]